MSACFYTDGPPSPDFAHGNHGIAKYFIKILAGDLGFVLTRRYRNAFSRASIESACSGVPLILHPDTSGWGLRRFFPAVAAFVDILLFAFWLPGQKKKFQRAGIRRIFVLCGSDAWFLLNVWLLQTLDIPTEIYLVDDIEASARHGASRRLRPWLQPLLAAVIKRSATVHAISPGFVEHLNERFGCRAQWLPLPSLSAPPAAELFRACTGEKRHIVFIGALNHLYVDALRDLYEEICRFNAEGNRDYKLVLEIISYGSAEAFLTSLPNRDWVVFFHKLPDTEMHRHLSSAYACILPYSFKPEERLMVSTSFSCKILEYYACGRPILVYGPAYASIPRYFCEENLPLCATNREELKAALTNLEAWQKAELLAHYSEVWKRHHSPEAIRANLRTLTE